MNHDNTCATCKWHGGFSAARCNGLSSDRANFTDPEHSCRVWEQAGDDAQSGKKGKGGNV